MQHAQPVRSYIIFGIYSLMVAAFYRWQASLFVLSISLFIEMFLLFVGSFFTQTREEDPVHIVDFKGAIFALLASLGLVLPMAYLLAERYGEFDPARVGTSNLVFHYGWQILLMAVCLGIGYLVDFKKLKTTDRKHFLTYEVYRVCLLIFGVTLVGLMCEEWIRETTHVHYTKSGQDLSPFQPENKMIPIVGMVCARMAIEIWYVRKVVMQREA